MLRFLEALNPWNSCFTATNFEDALIDIKVILNTVDCPSNDHSKPSPTFREKKLLLEKAYNLATTCLNAAAKPKPDKELSFLLADILRQYATLCFDENYFGAKQILLIALNLHLYTIGIFNECIDIRDFLSLEDLKKQCEAKPALFRSMEDTILSTSPDRCMTLAYKDSFVRPPSEKRLYSLAETVRWLGYSYKSIDQNKTITPENDLRFSQLFGLSESLYLFIDDDESKHALADLYFQAWPFMHGRKNPQDAAGIFQNYEKALFYDSSPEMQANIGNSLFVSLFENGQKSEALQVLKKAILGAESLEENERKQFLLSSLYDNYASYLMDPETLDLVEAGIYLQRVEAYVVRSRLDERDHLQFAFYDMRYAEYKLVMDEFDAAKEIIQRALNTIQKQPQSQQPHMIKAQALKSLIHKVANVS
ncbi:MAG TPA: hypothetical protein VGP47_06375 [Parachlamydiaceae bacterium]|nr:hypothetical protein [Parachlamydiaceae bacterium]